MLMSHDFFRIFIISNKSILMIYENEKASIMSILFRSNCENENEKRKKMESNRIVSDSIIVLMGYVSDFVRDYVFIKCW